AMGIDVWRVRVPGGAAPPPARVTSGATSGPRIADTVRADSKSRSASARSSTLHSESRPTTASAASMPAERGDIAGMPWDELAKTVATCRACPLHAGRTQTVFGVGNRNAEWLFIGEAPGAEEDRQGEPFVGRAGQLLNSMLFAIGTSRDQVYIANILKCRPPN